MTVSLTPRFSLTRWSDDEDEWSRQQFDTNTANLEQLAAITLTGTAQARPDAGQAGRFYDPTNLDGVLYYDDGTRWVTIPVSKPADYLVSSYTPPNGGVYSGSVKACIRGGLVVVRVAVSRIDSNQLTAGGVFLALPSQFWPADDQYAGGYPSNGVRIFAANGQVTAAAGGSNSVLATLTYPTNP